MAADYRMDPIRLRRSIGYVIQDGGLFPHFTVARNIALVPQIENWPKEKIESRVQEMLALVGLSPELLNRYPQQLSGGQRQRVGWQGHWLPIADLAFGRTVRRARPITRSEMQKEFRGLQHRMKKAAIFVTHDLREALLLADRVALMEDGRLIVNLP